MRRARRCPACASTMVGLCQATRILPTTARTRRMTVTPHPAPGQTRSSRPTISASTSDSSQRFFVSTTATHHHPHPSDALIRVSATRVCGSDRLRGSTLQPEQRQPVKRRRSTTSPRTMFRRDSRQPLLGPPTTPGGVCSARCCWTLRDGGSVGPPPRFLGPWCAPLWRAFCGRLRAHRGRRGRTAAEAGDRDLSDGHVVAMASNSRRLTAKSAGFRLQVHCARTPTGARGPPAGR